MIQTRVFVMNEVSYALDNGWTLCLQKCRYIHGDGTIEEGYRFIWKDKEGRLQAHRGQARIPSLAIAQKLIEKAIEAGWGKEEFD
ncbi:MAG: hypothetical protein L5655_10915 [Thermosediminibacteraceae bacterium]|nr:hypothetical protein [Thermosediminibacteraceae bacterium]